MTLESLKKECIKNHVPLIDDESIKFICNLIDQNKILSLLEIGSGLGYSSLYMSIHSLIENIDSLEKNEDRFLFIKNNIVSHKINYFLIDAFEFYPSKKYDLIFLDGPKAKQSILFEKYSKYLNDKGFIIVDNIKMLKLQFKKETKRIQKLLEKNRQFIEYLKNLEKWEVKFIDIGDGLALCRRK